MKELYGSAHWKVYALGERRLRIYKRRVSGTEDYNTDWSGYLWNDQTGWVEFYIARYNRSFANDEAYDIILGYAIMMIDG